MHIHVLNKQMIKIYVKTGKHCCLWCTITSQELKLNTHYPERTLQMLADDHEKFMASRGDPKNVKHFNNALHKPFFQIPLLQVKFHHYLK